MRQSYHLRSIAAACALGLAVLALGMSEPARAQSDVIENDNSIWTLERRLWNGVVRGLGLRSGDEPVIEYRERSPLVVPPSRDLPPPKAKAAAKDPAWPNDPDQARRKARAAAKKAAGNVDQSRSLDRQGNPIAPDQLDVPGGANPAAVSAAPAPGPEGRALLPSELGYFGGILSGSAWGFGGYKEEVATFTKEPPRQALTAPPTGYQTPSPDHPYGNTRRVEHTPVKQFDPAGR